MQRSQAPPSSRHSKVRLPGTLSVPVKLKLAELLLVGLFGCAVMLVSGAIVSTVQVWLAGDASTLPFSSSARTSKVWLPLGRLL